MTTEVEAGMTIANTEQAAAWDGHEGDVWTEHVDRYDRAGHRHVRRLLGSGLVGPTNTVLDIGCGTGLVTREFARRAGDGSAVGVDLSARMLECARARSIDEGLTNIDFVQADAQVHPFDDAAFDVAVSSFGAMFFNDPVAAFANIGRAVRPGGTLALLVWRDLARNEWLTELRGALAVGRQLPEPPPDAPTPFSLADPERVRRILGAAGYDTVGLEPIDEPMDLGTDADDAMAFVRTMGIVEGLTHDLDPATRAEAMAAVERSVVAHTTPDGVLFGSAAWLITARRA
jgi:SAM-dependent methyltransferase